MQRVYSLLVDNNSGVLSRISGLFTRRGYNIDSITAGVTADSRFTRITIVSSGDEIILSQIEKQIAKLEDVIVVKVLKPEESVYRELILEDPCQCTAAVRDCFNCWYLSRKDCWCRERVSRDWAYRNPVEAGSVLTAPGWLWDPGTCQNRNCRTVKRNQGCHIYRVVTNLNLYIY